MQQIEQLRAEQNRGQQVSCGLALTGQVNGPPLQNSTAIGHANDEVRRPGLATQSQHSVYMPTTELAEKRQVAICSNSAIQNPYMPLGTHVRTNVPQAQLQEIDVTQ